MVILGIESTAHTFGVGIVRNGKVLANIKKTYTTEKGGIIPLEAAKHHKKYAKEVYDEAIKEAGINEKEFDAIAFSQGPGLAPCLIQGMKFSKELSRKLDKPLVPVNHCIAHLEIGRVTKAKDPVMLYVSGANTQIIAYEGGKYRIFGETLDIGVGNFIDTIARSMDLGFPGGPKLEELSKSGKYIELPYSVKGMDITLSGIQTKIRQLIGKLPAHLRSQINGSEQTLSSSSLKRSVKEIDNSSAEKSGEVDFGATNNRAKGEVNYTLKDLAYSMQETVFAMLVETAERALAHTGKNELLLGGGVACNKRLQEMCKIMCKEREAKLFVLENSLLVDNAAMIAYLGEIMFKAGIKEMNLEKIDIHPRERTDDIEVSWK